MWGRSSERRARTYLHLHAHAASHLGDLLVNDDQRLLHELHAARLVRRVRGDDVERGGDEPDLDRDRLSREGLSSLEGGLDGVDALVREALDLDVGTDLHRLRGQSAGDVLLESLEELAVDVEAFEDLLRLARRVEKEGERTERMSHTGRQGLAREEKKRAATYLTESLKAS